FPSGTKITQPKGGFLLWVELPKTIDAIDIQDRALARKISIAPGPMFSPNQGFRNFIRISCGEAWTPRIGEAVRTLGKLCMGK
ncbi:MAG TPA: PLP-dependent aminotransferase family protein, partial [Prosthecobacter sp.]|nr:PLP-dependent aminotransferase family protein [Prosthecobacter sp.]